MGDLLDGIFKNLGVSGGRGNVKVKNTYLGENDYQKPLEDIMGLLASEANQQRAQRNLMFGGPGYGGSFETAEQRAQRAAGQPVDNSKPYGGWGGYGSGNAALSMGGSTGTPSQTQPGAPPWQPPTGDGDVPITNPQVPAPGGGGTPTGPGTTPIPPRGGDSTPPVTNPPTRGNFGDFLNSLMSELQKSQPSSTTTTAPRTGTQPTDGKTSRAAELQARYGKYMTPEVYDRQMAVYKVQGTSPEKIDARLKSIGSRPQNSQSTEAAAAGKGDWLAMAKQNNPNMTPAQLAAESKRYDQYVDIQDAIYKSGAVQGASQWSILNALGEGADPNDIKNHYLTLVNQYGPKIFTNEYAHGTASNLPAMDNIAEALRTGEATKNSVANFAGGGASYPARPVTRTASTPPTGTRSRLGEGVGYEAFSTASVPSDEVPPGGAPGAPAGFDPITGRPLNQGYAASSVATVPGTGEDITTTGGTTPPASPKPGDKWKNDDGTTYTYKNGRWMDTGGNAWEPPEGGDDTEGDPQNPTWQEFVKWLRTKYAQEGMENWTPEEVQAKWAEFFKENGGNGDPPDITDYFGEQGERDKWQRPSQFGQQGSNPSVDKDGNPLRPEQSISGPGYSVGDAWSTSAQWRPEAPTGGLYGAYSDLAGGNMTAYEQDMLKGWQDMSKTPGRGEDEAYGAYNTMLQGGYSPSEQNAITQEGMRAARAGFETNRDAMLRNQARTNNSAGYAANMAKMARGFSDTMGSQARQNEILFADETQKRRAAGAQGMLGVAGLSTQRKQTGLSGQQAAAGYGRDLQKQGLAGLHALYQGQSPTDVWGQAAEIGSKPRETYTETGNASGGF